MRQLCLLMCVTLSTLMLGCSHWSTQQKVGEAVWVASHIVDWGQTLDLVDDPTREELNPILGSRPSRGEVNLYMATLLVLHPVVANLLPDKYRTGFIWGTATIGVLNAGRNHALGLRVSF